MTDKQEAQSLSDAALLSMINYLEGALDHIKGERLPTGPAYRRLEAMKHEAKRRGNVMKIDTRGCLTLARKHVDEGSHAASARICLADAVRMFDAGDYPQATRWAVKSLEYSVGVFHADYKRVRAFRDRRGSTVTVEA